MTPEQLILSILKLAFSGKLVEQKNNEKITDNKSFNLSEPPFIIPNKWKWNTISGCSELYTGNSVSETEKKSKYIGLSKGFDYIGTKDVLFDHTIVYDNGVKIPFDNDFKKAPKGSILLCIEGGSAGRKIAILNKDVCFGNKLCMFNAITVYNRYLYFFLQSKEFKSAFADNVSGIIGGVSINKIKKMYIPIPPLEEQKRIVAKIEELLPLIDKYGEAWAKLKEFNKEFPIKMKKSILQYAIEGKLVEQKQTEGTGEECLKQMNVEKEKLIKTSCIKKEKPFAPIDKDEIPFEIPKNWCWCRFGELGAYKKGPFGSSLTKDMFVPKGQNTIKVYEQKNAIYKNHLLGDYYITKKYFESNMRSFEVFPGDIIVSCAGTIGETYVMPENMEKGIINQALMRMKIFKPMYIPYFLVLFETILKKNAISSSKGSAIKNIPPFDVLKNYLVPIPPLKEQERIVAKIEELLPLCKKLIKE